MKIFILKRYYGYNYIIRDLTEDWYDWEIKEDESVENVLKYILGYSSVDDLNSAINENPYKIEGSLNYLNVLIDKCDFNEKENDQGILEFYVVPENSKAIDVKKLYFELRDIYNKHIITIQKDEEYVKFLKLKSKFGDTEEKEYQEYLTLKNKFESD